ncbi:MAG TPA: Glu/Leu/Phe/Val dehydrogenase dimerization domain-containing protein [Candidatus Nitrosotenuis sp.]|nr:Glu/Leu/Phe/Val dehydrogenase dimerization domain-containing protein [Candidatus Nitrosotenuis sp.]
MLALNMIILDALKASDFEQLIVFQNRAAGLRGFLAIHDTTLGPALGGVRIRRYASEDEALDDCLRLARGMTYKASLAGLPCGGGKAVILDHDGLQRDAAFEAYGHLVESLRGRFFTGVDLGVTAADISAIARATRYVACESSPALGDISEHTAIGVWHGLRACLESAGLGGKKIRVAIQGVGSVGLHLARILRREGTELIVADVNAAAAAQAAQDFGARVAPPEEILSAECDVLAPCAVGGILNRQTIPNLRAKIVCGSANNQLATPEDGDALAQRGILYAPDYLVNAGGLIRGAEFYLLHRADSMSSLEQIYERMSRVAAQARERGISTARVADELAEARLKKNKTYADLCWGHSASSPKKCDAG